jgi:hypothetical protein
MEARIGGQPVHLLQLGQQPFTFIGPKLLLPVLAQCQEQGPPCRHVRFLIQPPDDGPGVGPERAEAVNEVTPHPWVTPRVVPQQRPELRRLTQPQQCDGGVGLPLRQHLFLLGRLL